MSAKKSGRTWRAEGDYWRDPMKPESPEGKALLEKIQKTHFDRDFSDRFWRIQNLELVRNKTLEDRYYQKRQELQGQGRRENDLEETFVFSVERLRVVDEICREGHKTGTKKKHILGRCSFGIHLARHYDILTRFMAFKQFADEAYIIAFKTCLGRFKPIVPRLSGDLEDSFVNPYPDFDCHISAKRTEATMQVVEAHHCSFAYFYEFDPISSNPMKYPRQILPYAVLQLYRKQFSPITLPFLAVHGSVSNPAWEIHGETRRGFRWTSADNNGRTDRVAKAGESVTRTMPTLKDQVKRQREKRSRSLTNSEDSDEDISPPMLSPCVPGSPQKSLPGKKPDFTNGQKDNGDSLQDEFWNFDKQSTEKKKTQLDANQVHGSCRGRMANKQSNNVPLSMRPYIQLMRVDGHYEKEKEHSSLERRQGPFSGRSLKSLNSNSNHKKRQSEREMAKRKTERELINSCPQGSGSSHMASNLVKDKLRNLLQMTATTKQQTPSDRRDLSGHEKTGTGLKTTPSSQQEVTSSNGAEGRQLIDQYGPVTSDVSCRNKKNELAFNAKQVEVHPSQNNKGILANFNDPRIQQNILANRNFVASFKKNLTSNTSKETEPACTNRSTSVGSAKPVRTLQLPKNSAVPKNVFNSPNNSSFTRGKSLHDVSLVQHATASKDMSKTGTDLNVQKQGMISGTPAYTATLNNGNTQVNVQHNNGLQRGLATGMTGQQTATTTPQLFAQIPRTTFPGEVFPYSGDLINCGKSSSECTETTNKTVSTRGLATSMASPGLTRTRSSQVTSGNTSISICKNQTNSPKHRSNVVISPTQSVHQSQCKPKLQVNGTADEASTPRVDKSTALRLQMFLQQSIQAAKKAIVDKQKTVQAKSSIGKPEETTGHGSRLDKSVVEKKMATAIESTAISSGEHASKGRQVKKSLASEICTSGGMHDEDSQETIIGEILMSPTDPRIIDGCPEEAKYVYTLESPKDRPTNFAGKIIDPQPAISFTSSSESVRLLHQETKVQCPAQTIERCKSHEIAEKVQLHATAKKTTPDQSTHQESPDMEVEIKPEMPSSPYPGEETGSKSDALIDIRKDHMCDQSHHQLGAIPEEDCNSPNKRAPVSLNTTDFSRSYDTRTTRPSLSTKSNEVCVVLEKEALQTSDAGSHKRQMLDKQEELLSSNLSVNSASFPTDLTGVIKTNTDGMWSVKVERLSSPYPGEEGNISDPAMPIITNIKCEVDDHFSSSATTPVVTSAGLPDKSVTKGNDSIDKNVDNNTQQDVGSNFKAQSNTVTGHVNKVIPVNVTASPECVYENSCRSEDVQLEQLSLPITNVTVHKEIKKEISYEEMTNNSQNSTVTNVPQGPVPETEARAFAGEHGKYSSEEESILQEVSNGETFESNTVAEKTDKNTVHKQTEHSQEKNNQNTYENENALEVSVPDSEESQMPVISEIKTERPCSPSLDITKHFDAQDTEQSAEVLADATNVTLNEIDRDANDEDNTTVESVHKTRKIERSFSPPRDNTSSFEAQSTQQSSEDEGLLGDATDETPHDVDRGKNDKDTTTSESVHKIDGSDVSEGSKSDETDIEGGIGNSNQESKGKGNSTSVKISKTPRECRNAILRTLNVLNNMLARIPADTKTSHKMTPNIKYSRVQKKNRKYRSSIESEKLGSHADSEQENDDEDLTSRMHCPKKKRADSLMKKFSACYEQRKTNPEAVIQITGKGKSGVKTKLRTCSNTMSETRSVSVLSCQKGKNVRKTSTASQNSTVSSPAYTVDAAVSRIDLSKSTSNDANQEDVSNDANYPKSLQKDLREKINAKKNSMNLNVPAEANNIQPAKKNSFLRFKPTSDTNGFAEFRDNHLHRRKHFPCRPAFHESSNRNDIGDKNTYDDDETEDTGFSEVQQFTPPHSSDEGLHSPFKQSSSLQDDMSRDEGVCTYVRKGKLMSDGDSLKTSSSVYSYAGSDEDEDCLLLDYDERQRAGNRYKGSFRNLNKEQRKRSRSDSCSKESDSHSPWKQAKTPTLFSHVRDMSPFRNSGFIPFRDRIKPSFWRNHELNQTRFSNRGRGSLSKRGRFSAYVNKTVKQRSEFKSRSAIQHGYNTPSSHDQSRHTGNGGDRNDLPRGSEVTSSVSQASKDVHPSPFENTTYVRPKRYLTDDLGPIKRPFSETRSDDTPKRVRFDAADVLSKSHSHSRFDATEQCPHGSADFNKDFTDYHGNKYNTSTQRHASNYSGNIDHRHWNTQTDSLGKTRQKMLDQINRAIEEYTRTFEESVDRAPINKDDRQKMEQTLARLNRTKNPGKQQRKFMKRLRNQLDNQKSAVSQSNSNVSNIVRSMTEERGNELMNVPGGSGIMEELFKTHIEKHLKHVAEKLKEELTQQIVKELPGSLPGTYRDSRYGYEEHGVASYRRQGDDFSRSYSNETRRHYNTRECYLEDTGSSRRSHEDEDNISSRSHSQSDHTSKSLKPSLLGPYKHSKFYTKDDSDSRTGHFAQRGLGSRTRSPNYSSQNQRDYSSKKTSYQSSSNSSSHSNYKSGPFSSKNRDDGFYKRKSPSSDRKVDSSSSPTDTKKRSDYN